MLTLGFIGWFLIEVMKYIEIKLALWGDNLKKMIEARKITKFFSVINPQGLAEGITAVLSVSLKVEEGEFVAIVGPTGCGKSTFLEILAGLQAPTEGEVYIDGKLVLEPLPSTRKEIETYQRKYRFLSPITNDLWRDIPKFDIAMIFQDYAVFPWMTALENVFFTLKLRRVPKGEKSYLAKKYLNLVGLNGAENKYPWPRNRASREIGELRKRIWYIYQYDATGEAVDYVI